MLYRIAINSISENTKHRFQNLMHLSIMILKGASNRLPIKTSDADCYGMHYKAGYAEMRN